MTLRIAEGGTPCGADWGFVTAQCEWHGVGAYEVLSIEEVVVMGKQTMRQAA
jgi:hypothetical protein